MPKNKDPAVLFYTADFLADTVLWTYEELGRYIKLLCIQHLQDGISEVDFNSVADGNPRISSKFNLDDDGYYRNKRMKDESDRRKEFCEKQRANRLNHLATKSQPNNNQTSTEVKPKRNPRVETENENDNGNIRDIIHYLNKKLGTKYQYGAEYIRRHINARLNEGYTLDDFKTVIDKKYKEWSGTEFAKFLRPETLFGTKFSTYLNQLDGEVKEAKYNDFSADDALERALERSYEEY